MIKANVIVKLKKDVLDPQGKALKTALSNIGFHNISQIRQGKVFDIEMDETNPDIAKKEIESICQNLLANPVIEDYDISVQKYSI
ncbi:phosphoribosylformylglycinamidine synthase, PurS protein [Candidatus Liberibacter solanacearum CLso-ZC1]|uniref:Phosphoribosylformylglycinamidine synthase subunit PurS n=1 Tax=Liberibacter solanacearum (strain CLso-ZC1) TaxID=658172 RepID=E4UDD3_LIBSC|nr:phosphoribosylformylglycinamidine synthase subunit PurS [Candidatus Liberibacter solanacearum]ADR52611.1 phosphoribosylformylglycinamidine synthase, PurS protein [Candidatus Liberibacter solanacearum CLso-ZC1]